VSGEGNGLNIFEIIRRDALIRRSEPAGNGAGKNAQQQHDKFPIGRCHPTLPISPDTHVNTVIALEALAQKMVLGLLGLGIGPGTLHPCGHKVWSFGPDYLLMTDQSEHF
jgi:hypothetical protein